MAIVIGKGSTRVASPAALGMALVLAAATLATAFPAKAQPADTAAVAAQQAYEKQVAACNAGNLPAPAREACVRNAGNALDRARGGPPVGVPIATPDGRATVIAPEGSVAPLADPVPPSLAPPPGSAGTVTTPDGRATIVQP
ncbi:MAG: hypothetical protein JWQ88_2849 [Rhodoferax sp.]|nr:hypothetical protein [Rhodoferax sp.]